MAFDLFAISAMSSECKRVFNRATYIISSKKSNLKSDIVETEETLYFKITSKVISIVFPRNF